jgi:hypothetical protein
VVIIGLLLPLWLATVSLAGSPQIHSLLHADANTVNHQCLFTQLQQQPSLDGFQAVVAADALNWIDLSQSPAYSEIFLSVDRRQSPSRGPPPLRCLVTVAG